MNLPPSFPPPARPDLADRLLAAVAERDQPMAERLLQQWVHRRGLQALDLLMTGPLLANQGPEAAAWLQDRVSLQHPPSSRVSPETLPTVVEQVAEQEGSPVNHEAVAASPAPLAAPLAAPVEAPVAVPAAASRFWPQFSVVPGGAPAPAPRALDPLRAWLPDAEEQEPGELDADTLPLAS